MQPILKALSSSLPLNFIYKVELKKVTKIKDKWVSSIKEGDKVFLFFDNGRWHLGNCLDKYNFVVTSCRGNGKGEFEFSAVNKITYELVNVKIQ